MIDELTSNHVTKDEFYMKQDKFLEGVTPEHFAQRAAATEIFPLSLTSSATSGRELFSLVPYLQTW